MVQPLKRRKERWPGVVVTALGCLAFLVWWFWPDHSDPTVGQAPTAQNFLSAAIKARGGAAAVNLDSDLFVIALQADHAGDAPLALQSQEAIETNAISELAALAIADVQDLEKGNGSKLASLLEAGDVSQAQALAVEAPTKERTGLVLEVARFLTQGGDFEQAKQLVESLPDELTDFSVEALVDVARLHAQWSEFDEAEQILIAVENLEMTEDERIAVARCAYELNLFQQAERIMASGAAQATEVKDVVALRRIGEAFLEFGQVEKARALSPSAYPDEDEASQLWELKLRLMENRPFAETLGMATSFEGGRREAALALKAYCSRQFESAEVPSIVWTENIAPGLNLKGQVEEGREAEAATGVEELEDVSSRARAYLGLARLLLWRGP
jgi:thioredoxin-like negative regulator of GroEL